MNKKKHNKTKTIGILGGMGPAATADFYRRIVESTYARRDQDHLHILIDSYPGVPDRTEFLLGYGRDPTPTLIDMARGLERLGAELLLMACNTASYFTPQVAASVNVPLLNWVDETSTGILVAQPKLQRLGLLGTTGIITSGLYQESFRSSDVSIAIPNKSIQEQVMEAIYGPFGVKAGSTNLCKACEAITGAYRDLRNAGAEAVLLACTELSLLFASCDLDWSSPVFDASQLVAMRVIILAGGCLKGLPEARMKHRLSTS